MGGGLRGEIEGAERGGGCERERDRPTDRELP